MKLLAHIISTAGKRLRSTTIETPSAGLDRATVHQAEQFARQWALDNDYRILSDIVSQGEYRAWVEPMSARRIETRRQLRETNARIAASAAGADSMSKPRVRSCSACFAVMRYQRPPQICPCCGHVHQSQRASASKPDPIAQPDPITTNHTDSNNGAVAEAWERVNAMGQEAAPQPQAAADDAITKEGGAA